MRVIMDVSHLNHRQISGVGIYTVELIRALKNEPDLDVIPVFRASRFRHRVHFELHSPGARVWWPGGWGIRGDVLHGTDFRVPPARGLARVLTVHDLSFLRPGMTAPDFAAKKKADLEREVTRTPPDAVITVSHATRRDLLALWPELEGRTHVVWLGADHLPLSAPEAPGTKPYFLFVGNLEARKNVLGLIEAFEFFCSAGRGDEDLVLIGKPGFGGEQILERVRRSPFAKRIVQPGYCPGERLARYYRQATALVYPSWMEGFGIPVVEAMRLGCPVITSKDTSTAEIAADTAWLIDPARPDGIAHAMIQARDLSPAERGERVQRARARALEFTWGRCARETLAVYRACRFHQA